MKSFKEKGLEEVKSLSTILASRISLNLCFLKFITELLDELS